MADRYIYFLIFFIPGVLLLIGGYIYKPPKEDIENFNITKFRLYSGAFLALLTALWIWLYG